jgi:hypothetical protein
MQLVQGRTPKPTRDETPSYKNDGVVNNVHTGWQWSPYRFDQETNTNNKLGMPLVKTISKRMTLCEIHLEGRNPNATQGTSEPQGKKGKKE